MPRMQASTWLIRMTSSVALIVSLLAMGTALPAQGWWNPADPPAGAAPPTPPAQGETPSDDPYPIPASLLKPRVVFLDESFEFDREHPIVGHWLGNLHTPRGVPAIALRVRTDESGDLVVLGSVTPGNLPNRPVDDLKIEDGVVSFSLLTYLDPQRIGRIRFTGAISEDGQRLKGTAVVPSDIPGQGVMDGEFELARTPLPLMLDTARAYCGQIEIDEGIFFDMNIVLATTPKGNWVGHVDIPLQAIAEWPFDRIESKDGLLTIHMGGGAPSTFEVRVTEDGSTLKGVYRTFQDIPIELKYKPDYSVPSVPTEFALPGAEEIKPYHSHEAIIDHPDGHFLSASVTTPDGPPGVKYPAAILLTAFGPQQRDNLLYGHRMFDVVADALAREGIVVIRYDDRGFGKSGGRFHNATIEDFASDALAAYNFARSLEQVDPSNIGFLGHDEGGNVAALAATRAAEPAFVVMLAPRGVRGDAYELSQLIEQMRFLPETVDAPLRERLVEAHKALLAGFIDNAPPERMQELALAFAEAQKDIAVAAGSPEMRDPAQGARLILSNMRRPGLAYLARFDPIETFKALNCPLLACWDSLDIESAPSVNAAPLQALAQEDGRDITVTIYERMNHLLQRASTGLTNEYARSRVAIEKSVLDDVAAWILSKTSGR